jgi:hypothetical protein
MDKLLKNKFVNKSFGCPALEDWLPSLGKTSDCIHNHILSPTSLKIITP